MKEIRIAVTPLVASILTTRYGSPVTVHRSDALYTYLQGNPVRVSQNKFRKLNRELTREVPLLVSNSIAHHIACAKRQLRIGLYLHKVYQQEMINWMQAQHEAGIPAQTALKNFLARNGVSEDDYALDTAYTVWKRKRDLFSKKADVSNSNTDQYELPENDSLLPKDPRDILSAVNHYYSCGMCNLVCRDLTARAANKTFRYIYDAELAHQHRKARKVAAYLLYKDAQLLGTEIAKIIHLSPRTLQRYVKATRFHLDYYTDIQHDVARIRQLYLR